MHRVAFTLTFCWIRWYAPILFSPHPARTSPHWSEGEDAPLLCRSLSFSPPPVVGRSWPSESETAIVTRASNRPRACLQSRVTCSRLLWFPEPSPLQHVQLGSDAQVGTCGARARHGTTLTPRADSLSFARARERGATPRHANAPVPGPATCGCKQ